jgi:ketosteroid isomerase-like protein
MSEENVEAIRELWALVGDDTTELDLSMVDPEVVYEDDVLPDHAGEVYVGHEGLRRAWAGFAEPWTDFKVELEWARGAGDEVVSVHRMRGRGRESGVETQADYAYVWTFREGRIVRIRSYGNTAEALKAAGLSE